MEQNQTKQLEWYDKLIATNPDIERKSTFDDIPFTSVNGNMFSFLSSTGIMVLRLPTAKRAVFLRK